MVGPQVSVLDHVIEGLDGFAVLWESKLIQGEPIVGIELQLG